MHTIAVSQRQLAENDGMCLLIEVMASSHSEELSKATTFVLQCCVYRNNQQGEWDFSNTPPIWLQLAYILVLLFG